MGEAMPKYNINNLLKGIMDISGRKGTSEFKTIAKHNKFCNICLRRIFKDEECYTWSNSKYFMHIDCEKASNRITSFEFKRQSGKKSKSKKTKDRSSSKVKLRGWRDIK